MLALKMEGAYEPRNADNLWMLDKARKDLSLRASRKNAVLPTF